MNNQQKEAEIDKHFNKARKHLRSIFETDSFIKWLRDDPQVSEKTAQAAIRAFRPESQADDNK